VLTEKQPGEVNHGFCLREQVELSFLSMSPVADRNQAMFFDPKARGCLTWAMRYRCKRLKYPNKSLDE